MKSLFAFLFFAVLLWQHVLSLNVNLVSKHWTDTLKIASITIRPLNPLIEKDQYGQYINFDITVKNTSNHILELSAIEASLFNKNGRLELRKSLNNNGPAPSISTIGNTIIKPGETLAIFNPFYSFTPLISMYCLKYKFFFDYADTKEEEARIKNRLPIDYDASVVKIITPQFYQTKTTLYLPLKGKLIVWDGHDFYAHHRRFPIGSPKVQALGVSANVNRYAYDFISIDKTGNMYRGSPFKKENWYAFAKPVYAPGSGKIIESRNDIPDNEFVGRTIKSPDIPDSVDLIGMGNHVIIDHENGEYSVLLHMEKGSVRYKAGDMVKAGQQIGNVGFSGDAIYPHVHYTVMNGPDGKVSEGLPSYFHDYKLYSGSHVVKIKMGRIDSGYIIQAEN